LKFVTNVELTFFSGTRMTTVTTKHYKHLPILGEQGFILTIFTVHPD